MTRAIDFMGVTEMKRFIVVPCLALLVLVQQFASAAETGELDIRRAVPDNVYLLVYGKHNPERDFQAQYYEDVWQTVQETEIIQDVVNLVTKSLSDEDVEKASAVIDEIRGAAEPIDIKALADCQEIIYSQRFVIAADQQQPSVPTADHLVLLRLTPEVAASTAEGIVNLLKLAEKYSQGDLPVQTSEENGATITTLMTPPPLPMQPTVAVIGDVLLISSSRDMADVSLAMLLGQDETASKFDDPRLKEALSKLPEPEDSLVFYDGRTQFDNMGRLGSMIRQMAGGDPEAAKVAGLIDLLFQELSVFDYEVTVEYTEGNHNCSASYGKLLPNVEDKMFVQMLSGGEPFEKWYEWVPADALSYSLHTGINLHPVYERVLAVVREQFPEAEQGLAQFEQLQKQYDVYLDRDILQAFSGEFVSVSLPASAMSGKSVTALRCQKPERIKELIHRGFDALQQIPAVQQQGIKLEEVEGLDGFEKLVVPMLQAFQVAPLIGFQDGWMYIASDPDAMKEVLAARSGDAETIESTESFQQFGMEIDGPVKSVSYKNLAESTRQTAAAVNQIGTMAPMFLAMAGQNADPADLEPVQDVLKLLPDLAKIIAKFDFLEAQMSVSQQGDEPGSYTKRAVTIVRAPDAE
jgi:hypothetical protein